MNPQADSKVVITCAVTGAGDSPSKNPAVPVTPAEIADSALDAASAGAAVVHLHVRDPDTAKPSMDLELYRELVDRVRQANPDVLLNLTTGPGARFLPRTDKPAQASEGTTLTAPQRRIEHVVALQPEICSLDMGSMNFGTFPLINIPEHVEAMAQAIRAAGVMPELEIFDAGHLRLALDMQRRGVLDTPGFFNLCLGVPWGAPALPESLMFLRSLLPADAPWSAFALGAMEMPFVAQSYIAGGHVRVGLEDNLYIAKGRLADSNAQLVERAASVIESLGGEIATPADARDVLGLSSVNSHA